MWVNKKLIGVIVALSSIASLSANAQAGRPLEALSNSLFPPVTCNVSRALPILRQKLDGRDLQTEWDGDFPWPDVLGVWTRADRDAYVIVGATETPTGKWGRVKVSVKSICSDLTLAQGARIITESDWTKPYLIVKLRNYSLNGSRLSAIVKTPQQPMCKTLSSAQTLEVKIVQETILDDGQMAVILRDTFIAEHL